MPRTGKPNKKGRSSGKYAGRNAKNRKPPEGESWIWNTEAMKRSVAFRSLCFNARKVLDRLEVEHCAHAGEQNGRLITTYDQFAEWNIRRNAIRSALDELITLGLLEETHEGRMYDNTREPNRYRLTYQPTYENGSWSKPTNEWKHVTQKDVLAWKSELKASRKKTSQFNSAGNGSDTELVSKMTLNSSRCPQKIGTVISHNSGGFSGKTDTAFHTMANPEPETDEIDQELMDSLCESRRAAEPPHSKAANDGGKHLLTTLQKMEGNP